MDLQCVFVVVVATVLAALHTCTAEDVATIRGSQNNKKIYCGTRLSETLSAVCKGNYNTLNKKSDSEYQHPNIYTSIIKYRSLDLTTTNNIHLLIVPNRNFLSRIPNRTTNNLQISIFSSELFLLSCSSVESFAPGFLLTVESKRNLFKNLNMIHLLLFLFF
jgi:hypothetical protein